jgi:predicted RNA binding protein YcfA (HicA-like mRNA interferase family)
LSDLPAISGKQLIKLLILDGWEIKKRGTHGMSLYKKIGNRRIVTTVPDKKDSLPNGTLGAILSVKQTQLGKKGLAKLISKHGMPANE